MRFGMGGQDRRIAGVPRGVHQKPNTLVKLGGILPRGKKYNSTDWDSL